MNGSAGNPCLRQCLNVIGHAMATVRTSNRSALN